jgi:hypothetical protein
VLHWGPEKFPKTSRPANTPRNAKTERSEVSARSSEASVLNPRSQEKTMEFNLEEAIPVLERTPAVLSALLDELPSILSDATERCASMNITSRGQTQLNCN